MEIFLRGVTYIATSLNIVTIHNLAFVSKTQGHYYKHLLITILVLKWTIFQFRQIVSQCSNFQLLKTSWEFLVVFLSELNPNKAHILQLILSQKFFYSVNCPPLLSLSFFFPFAIYLLKKLDCSLRRIVQSLNFVEYKQVPSFVFPEDGLLERFDQIQIQWWGD